MHQTLRATNIPRVISPETEIFFMCSNAMLRFMEMSCLSVIMNLYMIIFAYRLASGKTISATQKSVDLKRQYMLVGILPKDKDSKKKN